MKLIVEGPDGAGKSTVIEKLGLTRRHLKSLRGGVGGTTPAGWCGDDHPAVAYIKQLINAPDGTAFDRFYMSEQVYGPILRQGSAISTGAVQIVQDIERLMRIPTVVCLPSFETTFRNVTQPGRERPVYQTVDFLRTAYDRWVEAVSQRHDCIVFNYEAEDIRTLIINVRFHAGERS